MSKPSLRPATGADHGLYARFFAELGVDDPVLEPARWERESAPSTAFLVHEGRDAGYAHWELCGECVYLRHVVVDPTLRGRGLGRELMLRLAALLRAQGAREWRLNVMASNEVAIALYRSLDLRAIHTTVVLRLDWSEVARLPHLSSNSIEADPRFDAANEADFGLMQGQLARARERQGVRIFAAMNGDAKCMGLAAFDPRFPGAFPFRCKSPEYARGLIDAMRERYDGAKPWVQLVVEDNVSLVLALEVAGAARVHDIVHMRGPIPLGDER